MTGQRLKTIYDFFDAANEDIHLWCVVSAYVVHENPLKTDIIAQQKIMRTHDRWWTHLIVF